MKTMKVTALAPWFGSNRMLASHVGKALEGCEWVGVAFVGGMCEVAHISARTLQVNDLHKHIINLARVCAHPKYGPNLYRELRRMAFHPDTLARAQEWCRGVDSALWSATKYEPDPEWARHYFVTAWMSRHGTAGTSSEFKGGPSQRWNAGGGDSAAHFQGAIRALPEWRRLLRRANFTTLDAFDFIDKVKDQDGHGLYCDPPFPGPGDAYTHTFGTDGQIRLAKSVARFTKTRVVMRFYDHPLIRELYPEDRWTWHLRAGRTQTNYSSPEVLLVNRSAA